MAMAMAELLLTMGHLNRLLTCIVIVMAGYFGTYSSSGQACSGPTRWICPIPGR
jgi:hypothetical protein